MFQAINTELLSTLKQARTMLANYAAHDRLIGQRDDADYTSNQIAAIDAVIVRAEVPLVIVGDHTPEPLNENVSEPQYDRTQEALAHILGVA